MEDETETLIIGVFAIVIIVVIVGFLIGFYIASK